MSENILDSMIGDIVPHVHCKKITIQDATEMSDQGLPLDMPNSMRVTLSLCLYEKKSDFHKKQWLNNLTLPSDEFGEASNILDFMKIRILEIYHPISIPLVTKSADQDSVYVMKQRNAAQGTISKDYAHHIGTIGSLDVDPVDISVSMNSLLGDLGQAEALKDYENQGKIQTVIYNNQEYYEIPFEY